MIAIRVLSVKHSVQQSRHTMNYSEIDALIMNKRHLILILAILPALIASMACGDGDLDAPSLSAKSTAQAQFELQTATETAVAKQTKSDSPVVISRSSSSASEIVVTDSAAKTIDSAASTPQPTATSVPQPTATSAPQSTATPVPTATPEPTEVPVVDHGPWNTALEAIEIASKTQSGIIRIVDGHTSSRAGQIEEGDEASDVPSPGAGYGTYWTVISTGTENGSDATFCSVKGSEVDCFEQDYDPGAGNVVGVTIDSTKAFDVWVGNADWDDLMGDENLNILSVLEPGNGEFDPSHKFWTTIVSASSRTSGVGGGTFYWNLTTGEMSNTTWSY
jgi:hypothetical protein